MAPSYPKTIAEYHDWASATIGADFLSDKVRLRYDTNLANARSAIQSSEFYGLLPEVLRSTEAEYRAKTKAGLLMAGEALDLLQKPFTSAVEKTFRLNVLWNRQFPEPPSRGWVTPANWFAELDDLVRSTLTSKFLDGPEVLAGAIDMLATRCGLRSSSRSVERDDGYYAFHAAVTFRIPIVNEHWDAVETDFRLEIQLSTQLQEVLRELTHQFYEQTRLDPSPDRKRWKWRSSEPRFKAGFLSHTLHLLEGVILELRDSVGKPTNE